MEELKKPEKGKQTTNNISSQNEKGKNKSKVNVIKSPSDTTLYTPAMKKLINDGKNNKDHIIDRISNFVEEIRIETTRDMPATPATPPGAQGTPPVRNRPRQIEQGESSQEVRDNEMEHGPPEQRQQANMLREEAEQVRIPMEDPKGIAIVKNVVERKLNVDDNDDEFFHLTCHVDSSLKAKIERGEYIDLEYLLPKRKNFNQMITVWNGFPKMV